MMNPVTPLSKTWLAVFWGVFLWSAISPRDRFIWFLEVAPALIAFVIIAATRKRFPLTGLAYLLVLVHSVILMVGGKYTYAEVPLFNWLRDVLHHARNNYDKIGHFAQGFIPAVIAREILLRKEAVRPGGWLAFVVLSICLAASAFYEFIEWWVAVLTGEAADAFLGTQGYQWDTQSDMFCAFIGAVTALALLSRLHDRQLVAMQASQARSR